MLPFKKILVPTDFSDQSLHAMHAACELAKTFNAELILVHVYPPFVMVYPEGYLAINENANKDMVSYLEKSLEIHKQEAEQMIGKPVCTELLSGKDFEEIVRFSEQESIDLIVIGSHGRGALSRLFLGSVTEKVLRKSSCQVFVVRDDAMVHEPQMQAIGNEL